MALGSRRAWVGWLFVATALLACRSTSTGGDAGSSNEAAAPTTSAVPTPASAARASPFERDGDLELATTANVGRSSELRARIKELSAPFRTPRAIARMLRTLAKLAPTDAARGGCEILALPELEPAAAIDLDGPTRASLADLTTAALAAIANGPTSDPACRGVERFLGDEPCPPWFRCNAQGPLNGREASRQDEPLCTSTELVAVVRKELDRPIADDGDDPNPPRPELMALAELSRRKALPASLTKAHARRRYAMNQPKAPSCDRALDVGAPCHCDEATLRDHVCRLKDPGSTRVELCRFDVDDAKKSISNVTLSLP